MVTPADIIQRHKDDIATLKMFHTDLMALIAMRPLAENDNLTRAVEAIAAELARLDVKVIQGEALIRSHDRAKKNFDSIG